MIPRNLLQYSCDRQVAKGVWHHSRFLRPSRAMAGKGIARVTIRAAPVVEEKTAFTLLLVLLFFLHLYYSHNKNT